MIDRNDDGNLTETFWRIVIQPLLGSNGRTTDLVIHAVEISELVHARRELGERAGEVAVSSTPR